MIVQIIDSAGTKLLQFKANKIVASEPGVIPTLIRLDIRVAFSKDTIEEIESLKDIFWAIQKDNLNMFVKEHVYKIHDLPVAIRARLEKELMNCTSGKVIYDRCIQTDVLESIAKLVKNNFTFLIWDTYYCLVKDT